LHESSIDLYNDRHADLLRKWSLILSADPQQEEEFEETGWSEDDIKIDRVLSWVYGGGSGSSKGRSVKVNDWLRDVDFYFPKSISTIIQKDAIKRYGLELLLKDDAFIEHIVPDVHLAVTILKMKGLLPDTARHKARLIIDALARKLTDRFAFQTTAAIGRALRSPLTNRKPRYNNIHWSKTIFKNLHTYQPERRAIIPETLIGRQNRQKSIDTIFILIDQSGSMYESLVYAAIYGSIFSRIPALRTHLVLFDSDIADLTGQITDPVDVLFSSHMGGSTNIGRALQYALQECSNPDRALLVLISDLDETEDTAYMLHEAARAVSQFRKMITILALNKEGKGTWNTENAALFAGMDITCVASTPEQFPDICAEQIILSRS